MGVFALLVAAALPAAAGLLSGGGASVKDLTGVDRSQFSNNERVTLTARVANSVASPNRIQFTFRVQNPAGAQVFLHSGNSVPGSVGNSASQVSGLPVSQFFTGPGVYTFSADASLDGQTVSQSAQFTVSSPNIILIYPPNGAQGLADRPLSFRWVSSGATRYRVVVGGDPNFSGAQFPRVELLTTGGENFASYPENPANSQERMSAGQVYYWKVEGLDPAGNVVAQSDLPYSFSVQAAALTRDLAVTALEATGQSAAVVDFTVRVANQGGTSEPNVPLRFSVGGLPAPGSPLTLPMMAPSDSREYRFSAPIPADQAQALAIACVEFFDDNVPNNCKSIQVVRPAAAPTVDFAGGCSGSASQLASAIAQKLADLGYGDYDPGSLGDLSADDLCALLAQLNGNQVQISVTGPPPGAPPPPTYIPPPVSAAPPSFSSTESAAPPAELPEAALGQEFAGIALGKFGEKGLRELTRDAKSFRRLWKRLSNEDPPELDFKKVMLVSIVAGSKEGAQRVEVEDVLEALSGLVVRYRVVGGPGAGLAGAPKRAGVPYMLKVVRASGLEADFERVDKEGR